MRRRELHRAAEVLAGLLDDDRDCHDDRLEFLATIVAEEAAATRQRRLNAPPRFAHFPTRRTIEEFDFGFQEGDTYGHTCGVLSRQVT
jgi:IstB-like ATP binding protein